MNKLKHLAVLLLIGICFSCSRDDSVSQEQEGQDLNQMFSEIERLANSESCNDSATWTFTEFGSKACGGPIGFIAYSINIDTTLFLEKIETHSTAQDEYNRKWEVISDCSVPQQPSGITCKNGSPEFEY